MITGTDRLLFGLGAYYATFPDHPIEVLPIGAADGQGISVAAIGNTANRNNSSPNGPTGASAGAAHGETNSNTPDSGNKKGKSRKQRKKGKALSVSAIRNRAVAYNV